MCGIGLSAVNECIGLKVLDQAERGGRVPQRGNLRDVVDLVHFRALSSKIVGIQAMGGAFSLVFTFNCLVFMKIPLMHAKSIKSQ